MRAWWLVVGLAIGCGDAVEVARWYGEVHVHQYPAGAHVDATFLAQAMPADALVGDTIYAGGFPVALESGGCRVTLSPRCASKCAANEYCAGTRCEPLTELRFADGGAVEIEGGRVTPRVRMTYEHNVGYSTGPELPRGANVFAGGERLTIRGRGGEVPAFAGEVVAPRPLEASATQDAAVMWTPDGDGLIKVLYSVSRRDGEYAIVICTRDDADGTLTLPADVAALLPSAPRDVQVEISRNVLSPARALDDPRAAVLLHSASTVSFSWLE